MKLKNLCSAGSASLFLVVVILVCAALPAAAGKKKNNSNPQDPYVTAEDYEKAPTVNPADLAFRVVLFGDFTIPQEWEKDARKITDSTIAQAKARLTSTQAFTTVGTQQDTAPTDPYFVVKCTLLNYRMVSAKARFFAGAIAGTSYITYKVQVYDGKGTLQFQREISTENNAFAAAFSFNDKNLPTFLGNVLADYLALRARKDMGASAYPVVGGEHPTDAAATTSK